MLTCPVFQITHIRAEPRVGHSPASSTLPQQPSRALWAGTVVTSAPLQLLPSLAHRATARKELLQQTSSHPLTRKDPQDTQLCEKKVQQKAICREGYLLTFKKWDKYKNTLASILRYALKN